MKVAGNIVKERLLVPYAINMGSLMIYYVSSVTIISCYVCRQHIEAKSFTHTKCPINKEKFKERDISMAISPSKMTKSRHTP